MAPSAAETRTTDARSRLQLIVAGGVGLAAASPILRALLGTGAADAASKSEDLRILQLVLLVEYTQVALYERALNEASLTGELRDFAQIALGHERQHLAAVKQALGSKAGPKPRFEFGLKTKSADAFRETAIKLEDIAVAGYNGQATNLTKPTLAVAAEIVSVEARHAAWIRDLLGELPAPTAANPAEGAARVMAAIRRTGYVKGSA